MAAAPVLFSVKKKEKKSGKKQEVVSELLQNEEQNEVKRFVAQGPKGAEVEKAAVVHAAETPEERAKRKAEKEKRKAERKAKKAADKAALEAELAAKKKADELAEQKRKEEAIKKQAEADAVFRAEIEKEKKKTVDERMTGLSDFIKTSKSKKKKEKKHMVVEEMPPEEKVVALQQADTIVHAFKRREDEKSHAPPSPAPDAAAPAKGAGDEAAPADRRPDRLRKGFVSNFVADPKDAWKPRHAVNILTMCNPNPNFEELFGVVKGAGNHRWRIQNFDPVKETSEGSAGATFSDGEVYLVLHLPPRAEAEHWMAARAAHNQHLHLWIGKNASLDKRTAGAIRAVLLAQYVGGAVQHVEEQGSESDRFKSYYMGDMKVIPGGAPSGFRPSKQPPRPISLYSLIERKGKLFVRRVPATRSWLNVNGAFVLDAPTGVWAWAGTGASPHQAFQALSLAAYLNVSERRSSVPVLFCQQNTEAERGFIASLLDDSGEPSTAGRGADELESLAASDVLYGTTTDEAGNTTLGIDWSCADSGFDALQRTLLRSKNAFVLDAGQEVLTWFGAKTTAYERQSIGVIAQKLLADKQAAEELGKSKESSHWVVRCFDSGEPVTWKGKFPGWLAFTPALKRPAPRWIPRPLAKPIPAPTINFKQLLMPALSMEEEEAPPAQDGTTQIWVQEGNYFEALPAEEVGVFYSSNAYVVMYSYTETAQSSREKNKQRYICYYWLGSAAPSTAFPRFLNGLYAMLAPKIRSSTGMWPTLVPVQQLTEPDHFLAQFSGNIVVKAGARSSPPKPTRLFQCNVVSARRAYAVEVPASRATLNSKYVFLVLTASSLHSWYGSEAGNPNINQLYVKIMGSLSNVQVKEGSEPAAFWDLLGGASSPASQCDVAFAKKYSWARLIRVSNHTGTLTVEEVPAFTQGHLDRSPTDCFLLDVFHEVYLWQGSAISLPLLRSALDFAKNFTSAAVAARKVAEIPLATQRQYAEEAAFTRHFFAWQPRKAPVDPRAAGEARLKKLEYEEYQRRRVQEKEDRETVRTRQQQLNALYLQKAEEAKAAVEAARQAAAAAADAATKQKLLAEAAAVKKTPVALPSLPTPAADKDDAEEEFQEKLEAAAASNRKEVVVSSPCPACNKPLSGQLLTGLGKQWHPACFVCRTCKKDISGGFLVGGDFPYCIPCHKKAFGEPCAGCGKPTEGETSSLMALNKLWHRRCFVCTNCKGSVAKAYVEEKGMPYCEDCADELFSEPCCRCKKPLQGEFLKALGKKWHPQCFSCAQCGGAEGSLEDGVITGPDGSLYCERCDPQKCDVCKRGLGSKRVSACDKLFHPKCYVCAGCAKPGSLDDGFLEGDDDGMPYCERCYDKWYTRPCSACGKALQNECVKVQLGGKEVNWHKGCFACSVCRTPLLQQQYIAKGGKVFCKNHDPNAKKLELPAQMKKAASTKELKPPAAPAAPAVIPPEEQCPACLKQLGAKRMAALGRKWHLECFVCRSCKGDLEDGFLERDGMPYCEDCIKKLPKAVPSSHPPPASSSSTRAPAAVPTPAATAPAPTPTPAPAPASTPTSSAPASHDPNNCPTCGKPLGPKRVVALEKKWHPECLVCQKCKQPGSLDDGFLERKGLPYCAPCAKTIPRT